MDARLINPFISSTLNVIKTMAQIEAIAGTPYAVKDNKTWGAVTGLIGMAGPAVSGYMIISFDQGSILAIVSAMLMEKFESITPEITDAVGEITNMIVGGTKPQLAEAGYQIEMATPMTLTGSNVEISQISNQPKIVVPFDTPAGRFLVEASIARRN